MPRALASSTLGLSDDVYTSILARATKRPDRIHRLNVGDSWMSPPPALVSELAHVRGDGHAFQYPPPQGAETFLAAIERRLARRWGARVPRECLLATAGATSAISIVAQTLLEPGDEVLLAAPYWPLVRGIVSSRGAVPRDVPFHDRLDDATFDPERALEAAVGPRTSALYLNTPNNPTGTIASPEVLDAIARVVLRHDLWLVLDETYEDLVYDGTAPSPLWLREDLSARTIAVHTMSKAYAMAGARVGFVHGPARAMAAVRGVHVFQMYAASRALQTVAARVLDESDAWLDAARSAYAAAGRRLAAALGVATPRAGTFVFLDCRRFFAPHEDLDAFLVRCLEAGVLLAPGSACGRDYATWARACFTVVPPEDLDDAITRLAPLVARAG